MDTSAEQNIWNGISECVTHPRPAMPDEDCDGCKNEITARHAVIDQMQAEGVDRATRLAQYGVQMPQHVLTAMRMDLIVDTLFEDPRNRALFEGEFGRRVLESMKEAQEQAEKPVLHVPDSGSVRNLRAVKDQPQA